MTRAECNAVCRKLTATSHVVQWGGADVWKVGGKVFAIVTGTPAVPHVTFKVSPLAFEVLRAQPGLRPAPYLASRGLSWIQHFAVPGLSDAELRDHIEASHALVAAALTRRMRVALGLGGKAP